jgi:hypothetical protein
MITIILKKPFVARYFTWLLRFWSINADYFAVREMYGHSGYAC